MPAADIEKAGYAIPDVIIPAQWEGLNLLCWSFDRRMPMSPEMAYGVYARNWSYLGGEIGCAEEALVRVLCDRFGGGFYPPG